jgi:glutathione peroxidase
MSSSGWSSHFGKAFLWSKETRIDRVEIASSAIGIAGPALLGAAAGHIASGLAASLGGLMIGGILQSLSWQAGMAEAAAGAVPAVGATVLAALLAGHGWVAEAVMIVLAGAAALFGGYSRPAAVAAARFVPYLIIAFSAAQPSANRIGFVLIVIGGVALTIVSGALLAMLWRKLGYAPAPPAGPPASTATAAQKWARWRRLFWQMAGWQYTLRLTICLALASLIQLGWWEHHFLWVLLTVSLLMERQIEAVPIKTTQRVLGTALGVLLTALFLFHWPPAALLVGLLTLLAAARPVARSSNYLFYSLIQTMIIVIILDGGRPPETGLLWDRLIATLIGAGLVIGCNSLFAQFVKTAEPATPRTSPIARPSPISAGSSSSRSLPMTDLKSIPLARIDGTPATLADYAGQVLLIVNVASKCGLTPQYEGLEALYRAKHDQGLEVLGFPANNFKGQEPGTDEEIAAFCSLTYDVTFPMFSKISVKGEDQHPLYKALTDAKPEATGGEAFRKRMIDNGQGPEKPSDILWNFEKFLVSRDGKVIGRYPPNMPATDPVIAQDIDKALAG